MGKGTATLIVKKRGEVLLVSRNRVKLEHAKAEIIAECGNDLSVGERISIAELDFLDEESVRTFFDRVPANHYDGMVLSAFGRAHHSSLFELDTVSAPKEGEETGLQREQRADQHRREAQQRQTEY
jgi:NAD(P)-dependent dehydrogenase (short-subunit alcohol dehydrogenase family)